MKINNNVMHVKSILVKLSDTLVNLFYDIAQLTYIFCSDTSINKGKEGHMGKGCHERAYASYKHINSCWVECRECRNVI